MSKIGVLELTSLLTLAFGIIKPESKLGVAYFENIYLLNFLVI